MSDEPNPNGPLDNWSSSFVRNRAETVTLALLIFSTVHLNADFTKIPLLGIEFKSPVPRGTILIFLFSFFFYFAVAWCLRFRVEIMKTGRPGELHEAFLTKSMDVLSSIPPAQSIKVQPALDLISRLDDTKRAIDRAGAGFTNREQVTRYISESLHIRNGVSSNQMIAGFEHSIKQGLDSIAERFQKIDQYWVDYLEKFSADINDSIARIDSAVKEKQKAIEDSAPAIERVSIELHALRTSFEKDTKGMRNAAAWDKVWFGFYIPVVFALLLTLVALGETFGILRLSNVIEPIHQETVTPR